MARPGDAALRSRARRVGQSLRETGLTIATAESCTGGLLAKCLTDIAGSSDYFERGWVTYSNAAKQSELGVAPGLIARHGAVSEAVALAMVRGTLRRSKARVAISVTGIAGPGGARPGKPVGTVWIGWGFRLQGRLTVFALGYRFKGDRDAVRRQAVSAAFGGLIDQ